MTSIYWCILICGILNIFSLVTGDDEWETDKNDPSYKNHPCKRTCVANDTRTCYYKFSAEWFYAMSKACYNCSTNTSDCFRKDCIVADGVPRHVMSINRMMPGPSIEVCYGDKIIIDLCNEMPDQTCSIHWHGHRQAYSPFMDGVPYITQCPVLPFTTFRYTMYATNCGTHWWHSHVGSQRSDGMYGAFIVRVPNESDPMNKFYDFDEHTLLLSDWSNKTSTTEFWQYYLGSSLAEKATSILINGVGPPWDNGTAMTTSPVHRITVTKGYRHRFRVICAASLVCQMEIYVDNHNLSVIATDGENIQPVTSDSIYMVNGECLDFVLNANQTEDCYWIRITGSLSCANVHQVAMLCYENATNSKPTAAVGYNIHTPYTKQFNPCNTYDNATDSISINDLCAFEEPCISVGTDPSLEDKVQHQYFVEYNFRGVNHPKYHRVPYGYDQVNSTYQCLTPQLNNFTFKNPTSTLYTQWNEIDMSMSCANINASRCNDGELCECMHIYEVPTNGTVELVFIDKGAVQLCHPIHIHGFVFFVVSMEYVPGITIDKFKELDEAGNVKRHLKTPCIPARKDVVACPSPGYTVVRFWANNPGVWFVHCHVEPHLETGMAMVIKVGDYDEWVKPPPDFPTCGNFKSICNKSTSAV